MPAPIEMAAIARPVRALPMASYAKWPPSALAGANTALATIMEAQEATTAGVRAAYASGLSPEEARVISSTKMAPASGMPMKVVSAPAAPA